MAPTVRDYMNKQLVYLRDGDRVEIAKQPIIDFGITAVPVLDDAHRPVGVVSLRDLVEHGVRATRSKEPVAMVAVDAPITARRKSSQRQTSTTSSSWIRRGPRWG